MIRHTVTVEGNADQTVVSFLIHERPWTTNAERKGNRYQRASKTSEWRQMFGWLARSVSLPTLTDATVHVWLLQKGRLQDTGACHPAVKAAVDGFVDAKLLLNDTGEHVAALVFHAPERAKYDQITITVEGKVIDANG